MSLPCPTSCREIYRPVCGSDDVTYDNVCFLWMHSCTTGDEVGVAHMGECCPTGCPDVWDPVCGTDGNTYSNACDLRMHACENGLDIDVDYPGECQ